MKADIKTIARMLGVSVTTVSRSLYNTVRIGDETRAKVKKLAEELNYRHNVIARGLRAKKTAAIGVMVIDIAGSFYPKLRAGVEEVVSLND